MPEPPGRVNNLSDFLFLHAVYQYLQSKRVVQSLTIILVSAKPPSIFLSCIRTGFGSFALYSHIRNRPAVAGSERGIIVTALMVDGDASDVFSDSPLGENVLSSSVCILLNVKSVVTAKVESSDKTDHVARAFL